VVVIKGEEKEGRKKAIGGDKVPYVSTQQKNRQSPSKYHKLIKAL
jgi:hypothetical protein